MEKIEEVQKLGVDDLNGGVDNIQPINAKSKSRDTNIHHTKYKKDPIETYLHHNFLETPKNQPDKIYLFDSEYTDVNSQMIKDISADLTRGLKTEAEKTQALFYWVRDKVKYSVGLNKDNASQTLLKEFGSCLNKANVLVSLLRAIHIPAGFSILRVKTKEYFGPLGFERLRPYVSDQSNHIYSQAFINKRWTKLDCTDDIELSKNTMHLEQQGVPVDFDGYNDACLHLEPNHVVCDKGDVLQNVDYIFRKKQRVPQFMIRVMNVFMSYARYNGKFCNSVGEMESLCFDFLKRNYPKDYKLLRILESETLGKPIQHVYQMKRKLDQKRKDVKGLIKVKYDLEL